MTEYRLVKGDTSPIVKLFVEGYDTLDTNWSCRIIVKKTLDPNETVVVDKIADIKNEAGVGDYFACYLNPGETGILDVGTRYYWVFLITNDTLTPPFRKEIQNVLIITPNALPL